MHTILIVAGIALAVFLFLFIKNIARHKMFRRGWAIFIWRFISGAHFEGRPLTDAGWIRRGTKPLTQTGYAPRYYFWPRWQRMLLRLAMPIVPALSVIGMFTATVATEASMATLAAIASALLVRKTINVAQQHSLSSNWLTPLHKKLAPMANVALAASPKSWLSITPDRKRARIELPASYHGTELQKKRFVMAAVEALGIEDPDAHWNLEGKTPYLELEESDTPTSVKLVDVVKYLTGREPIAEGRYLAEDEIMCGLGKRSAPVTVSLHSDSPHVGASMGAGAGKSTLARFIAAQALYKGWTVVFLDIKRISHVWARGLPGVIYADTPELIHEALMWLGGVLDNRNERALTQAMAHQEIDGFEPNVGKRILIIAEELNLTANRLASWWIETQQAAGISNPGQVPSLVMLQDIAFAGRQVLMNIVFIGQMLTARVTGGQVGGNEARENMGVRMLARYTERNWKLLVPEHPVPPLTDIMGRVQVVASGKVRENQVPFLLETDARKMAKTGQPNEIPVFPELPPILYNPLASIKPMTAHPDYDQVFPKWPGVDSENWVDPKQKALDPTVNVVTDPDVHDSMPLLTLSEIASQHLFPGVSIEVLRNARKRDPKFPGTAGRNATAHTYNLADIRAWYEVSRKKGKKSS